LTKIKAIETNLTDCRMGPVWNKAPIAPSPSALRRFEPGMSHAMLDSTDRKILNLYQAEFPLTQRPFAEIGEAVGVSEDEALTRVSRMMEEGYFTGVGLDYDRDSIGESASICALAVAHGQSQKAVAGLECNPNSSQIFIADHAMNIWFTLVADSAPALKESCGEIERSLGWPILRIPIIREFHADFRVQL